MSIRSDFIEGLLLADEDVSLDFKREQYAFVGADKGSKSELLKDVLAFVNAFRRADAYILIGVEETRGGRSTVVGVQEHLDDAKLQQFVNSKTQLPVTFSYREASHDGLPIGVIHIPVQTRPVYAIVNYGKVTKEDVYIRRGSSTGVAKPEEIMRMSAAAVDAALQPTVKLHLVERGTGQVLGDRVLVEEPTWLEAPPQEKIPDYAPGDPMGTGQVRIVMPDPTANADFYRELAAYLQTEACFRTSLELENSSGGVIHDARLAIELADPDRLYELLGSDDRPRTPARSISAILDRAIAGRMAPGDVLVRREGDVWKVECRFGKIQPRAKVRLDEDLLIGSRSAQEVEIRGRVYGDNIVTPISVGFTLHFLSGLRQLTVREIKELARIFVT